MLSIRPLSDCLREKAKNEINEVPERIEEDLKDIEEWLTKQPHLTVRKDTQWMVSFLRSCKFSLHRTKEKLDFFYTMRSITPEFFGNRNPFSPELQAILDANIVVPVIESTDKANFPLIMIVRWGTADPDKHWFSDLFKVAVMTMDILLNENDNFTISGLYILHDMVGFSLGYMKHITPAICKKLVLTIQTAYPIRNKGIYFMNTPTVYEVFINMFRPFFSEKLKKRVKVFGESATKTLLEEEIPVRLLPKEYGGEAASMEVLGAEWKKKIESYSKWFEEDAQYHSNEEKRVGKAKTSADFFGVEGSFRKLSVD